MSLPDTIDFAFGDEVFHKTAPTEMGIVVGIRFYPGGHMIEVQWDKETIRGHYPFELSKEKSFVATN